jgi:predicted HicB family RNase H-like nuclease
MTAATAASPDKTRNTLLNFRVAAGERQQLQQLAQAEGLSLSGLVRQALQAKGFKPCR